MNLAEGFCRSRRRARVFGSVASTPTAWRLLADTDERALSDFGVNAVWLELSLAAIDLPAWTRVLLLDGELATAKPKNLRNRILHVAARITRGGRRLRLRISATWPWRHELADAFHRLAALPRPAD